MKTPTEIINEWRAIHEPTKVDYVPPKPSKRRAKRKWQRSPLKPGGKLS